MQLNFKARQFIIESIDYRIDWYQEQLQRADLDEDQRSDLTNDLYYLRALVGDLKKDKGDLSTT